MYQKIILLLGIIIIILTGNNLEITKVYASNAEYTQDRKYPSQERLGVSIGKKPTEADYMDEKYGIIAEFGSNTSLVAAHGYLPYSRGNSHTMDRIYTKLEDSDKGNIRMKYTNVATYKGRLLDLELTVMDWKQQEDVFDENKHEDWLDGPYIRFGTKAIGIYQGGHEYVEYRMRYTYAGTDVVANIPGHYMTITDLDMNQSISFDKKNYAKIGEQYIYDTVEPTLVHTWKRGNRRHVGSVNYQNVSTTNKRAWVTQFYDGNEITFRWEKNYHRPTSSGYSYEGRYVNFANIGSSGSVPGGRISELFEYTAEKPVRTEIVTPQKDAVQSKGYQDGVERTTLLGFIRDKNGVNQYKIDDLGQSYDYVVTHTVPHETSKYYYSKYVIEDKIDDALDIEYVDVYDKHRQNVSNKFNITTDNNKVKVTAKAKTLNNSDFYQNNYTVIIGVSVADAHKLEESSVKEGYFETNNKATVTTNYETKTSNEVKVLIPKPKNIPSPEKSIKNEDGVKRVVSVMESVDDTTVYEIEQQIPEDYKVFKLSEFKIEDKLDDRWDIVSVDINKDEFDVEVDRQTNKVTAKAKKSALRGNSFYGKTHNMKIKVKLKTERDFRESLRDVPEIVIENKAEVTINEEVKETNTVWTEYTIPKLSAPSKYITTDRDDKYYIANTLRDLGDTVYYNIMHEVPKSFNKLKFGIYYIQDDIDPIWKVDKERIRVYESTSPGLNTGSEVGKFDIELTRDNQLKVKPKINELGKDSFYGKYYKIVVPVKLKSPKEVIKKQGKTGKQTIENKANVYAESIYAELLETNKVSTYMTLPKSYYRDIEVEKIWKNDTEYDRPNSITVELYQNGNKIQTQKITKDSGWKHTFKDLERYEDNWNEYEYTIKEVKVNGYETDIEQRADKYTITNTLTYDPPTPPIKKDINGKKHEVIDIGEEFKYNLKYKVGTDLLGYKEVYVEDIIDNRLDVLSTKITSGSKNLGTMDKSGQKLSKTFDRKTLEGIKGQTVDIEIKAKIKPHTKIEKINNKGDLTLNNKTNEKTVTETVTVQPSPVEVGIQKIQIYTDKKSKGLPVKVDFRVLEENHAHKADTFKLVLKEKDTGKQVYSTNVPLKDTYKDTYKQLKFTIPSTHLTKGGIENYEASIVSSNKEIIKPIKNEGKLDTDGYVSEDRNIELDISEGLDKTKEKCLADDTCTVDGDKFIYKNVVKTEREIKNGVKQEMKKFYEEIVIPLKEVEKQKTGYGVELDREVEYKLNTEDPDIQLKSSNEIDAGIYFDNKLYQKGSETYPDYVPFKKGAKDGYEKKDGKRYIEMDITKTVEKKNKQGIEKYNYQLPKVWVERGSGDLYTENLPSKKLIDGGHKLYIPIWLDKAGEEAKYEVIFKSNAGIGIHDINFEVKDKLHVYAYMFAHYGEQETRSATFKLDEILLKPFNYDGEGKAPTGLTGEVKEWLER